MTGLVVEIIAVSQVTFWLGYFLGHWAQTLSQEGEYGKL